jgi:hypothetical protein
MEEMSGGILDHLAPFLSLLGTGMTVVLYGILFHKAGLPGWMKLLAALPLIGHALMSYMPAMMFGATSGAGGMSASSLVLIVTMINLIFWLTPLLLLAVLSWPSTNNSRD